MLKISPKVIDVEGNRVGYLNDYDMKHQQDIKLGQERNGVFFGGVGRTKSSYKEGRFPTQLFTNIKNDKYKYVKHIT